MEEERKNGEASQQSPQNKKDEAATAVELRKAAKKADFLKSYSLTANISVSCQQVSINRWTYYDWMKKDPCFADEVHAIRESMVDLVESKLMSLIKEGNVAATIFFLKCQGKHRGYIERQEVTGADGKPLFDPMTMTRNVADGVRDALEDPAVRAKVVEMQEMIDARAGAIRVQPPTEDEPMRH